MEALGSGKCQVTLDCLASGGGNVTYTWYKGGEWIPTPRSPFLLEEQMDANGWHTYTCNASTLSAERARASSWARAVGVPAGVSAALGAGTGRRVLCPGPTQEQEPGGLGALRQGPGL